LNFEKLNIIAPILKALSLKGYTLPTPIQEQAIPVVLSGRDLVGCAQTGTGKTAAFAIPLLQNLYNEQQKALQNRPADQPQYSKLHGHRITPRKIQALIVTPTRELAIQIDESFHAYGKFTGLKHTVIFGGVSQNPQTSLLKGGIDILVATPGRLLDLIGQKFISLADVKFFVLDEADRMLDMGFVHDMKKIIALLPADKQTLLFSATMPQEIQKIADVLLKNPAKVAVTPISSTVDMVDQQVYFVEKAQKKLLLIHLLKDKALESVLVFTRTKHGADKVVKDLAKARILAHAIHGNKSQNARQFALNQFKQKNTRVLVATDIAARGIDVQELTHVINYDIPNIPETYVHRIGRTGRAGLGGTAISFCDHEERAFLKDIQKLISKQIDVAKNNPFAAAD